MTVFWILIIAFIAVSFWLIIPALRGKKLLHDQDINQLNISIARERLNELEKEFNNQQIDEEEYKQTKAELEKALLNDINDADSEKSQTQVHKNILISVLLITPVLSIALYLQLGNLDAIDFEARDAQQSQQSIPHGSSKTQMGSIDDMVNQLALKLEKNPGNIKGWKMLGRSYMSLRRFSEAALAYGKAYELAPNELDIMLSYADALAMSNQGRINGKAFDLVKKALQINPVSATGLWLAGLGYDEIGEYETAVQHWRKLEPMLANNPQSQLEIRNLIAAAESRLGRTVTITQDEKTEKPKSTGAAIQVKVKLSKEIAHMANQDDSVFIYAKAVNGPPMPLAAVRKKVSDLPVIITLDDSMAMMPQLKLSSFEHVTLGARVSKSGQAITQPGDLTGEVTPVSTKSSEGITLIITNVAK